MRGWWVCVGVLVFAGSVGAVQPRIWEQETQAQFLEGEVEDLSISREGTVRLGPAVDLLAETGEGYVWSLARDSKGTLYAGTGNEGRIYRVGPDGQVNLLYDSPEVAIFALAVGSNGTVYAGSSPGGLIYAIDPGQEPRTLAETGDSHVWALELGRGRLFAATGGEQGRVVSVSLDGKVETLLEAADANVVSLLRTSDGTLFAGTDENGLVYRHDDRGTAVLYDAIENEIHDLALGDDGTLYAVAMSQPTRPPSAGGSNGRSSEGSASGSSRSALYAIKPTGSGFRVWESPASMLLSVGVLSDGAAEIVTGDEGGLHHVYPRGGQTLVARLKDQSPWTFLTDGEGGGLIGSAGTGEVWSIGSKPAERGILTSEPEDFNLVSRWGTLTYQAELPRRSSVEFKTRSGNREAPDETWSAWATVDKGRISSPAARFIQYRATLSGTERAQPLLRRVRVAGLQENVRPVVLTLEVENGTGPSNEGSGGGNGRGEVERGVWKIEWKGADVNDDALTYALHFKGRAEREWKLLAEDLTATDYAWQTDSAPEGSVQVRLTVSDKASNPPHLALSAERLSEPFEVDHTPPSVSLEVAPRGAGVVRLTGRATDATTPLVEAAYSVNSGPWRVLFPSDDIFDSKEETFDAKVDGLTPGEYTLVVRVVDGLGNVGVAKRLFDVRK
ncbi:MAG: hypothetical protein CME26_07640 [Gemmatimonadetes bacterium]|nr:hypothetical protein [Gemmatimonadota bacterium]|tara:strand:- start:4552 stop:6570 length:2019 start_codon:yes stop_codon:yes gene_type:complete